MNNAYRNPVLQRLLAAANGRPLSGWSEVAYQTGQTWASSAARPSQCWFPESGVLALEQKIQDSHVEVALVGCANGTPLPEQEGVRLRALTDGRAHVLPAAVVLSMCSCSVSKRWQCRWPAGPIACGTTGFRKAWPTACSGLTRPAHRKFWSGRRTICQVASRYCPPRWTVLCRPWRVPGPSACRGRCCACKIPVCWNPWLVVATRHRQRGMSVALRPSPASQPVSESSACADRLWPVPRRP